MTPHLDELISLVSHPAIQGRRGEWQVGDRIYGAAGNGIVIVVHKYALTVSFPKGCVMLEKDIIAQPPRHIWLPPLSDPLRPERSLLRMCPITAWLVPIYTLGQPPICWECQWVTPDGETVVVGAPTPEIAVAKAIIAKEEP